MRVDGTEGFFAAGQGIGDGGDVEAGAGDLEGGGGRMAGGEDACAQGRELEGLFDDDAFVRWSGEFRGGSRGCFGLGGGCTGELAFFAWCFGVLAVFDFEGAVFVGVVSFSLAGCFGLSGYQVEERFEVVRAVVEVFPDEVVCVGGGAGVAASSTDKDLLVVL